MDEQSAVDVHESSCQPGNPHEVMVADEMEAAVAPDAVHEDATKVDAATNAEIEDISLATAEEADVVAGAGNFLIFARFLSVSTTGKVTHAY